MNRMIKSFQGLKVQMKNIANLLDDSPVVFNNTVAVLQVLQFQVVLSTLLQLFQCAYLVIILSVLQLPLTQEKLLVSMLLHSVFSQKKNHSAYNLLLQMIVCMYTKYVKIRINIRILNQVSSFFSVESSILRKLLIFKLFIHFYL